MLRTVFKENADIVAVRSIRAGLTEKYGGRIVNYTVSGSGNYSVRYSDYPQLCSSDLNSIMSHTVTLKILHSLSTVAVLKALLCFSRLIVLLLM